jgi:hypothetical protein
MFAPAIETVDAVKSWLAAYGISDDRIAVSDHQEYNAEAVISME